MSAVLIPILIIAILIILNGIFVAAEFAIVAVRKTRIIQLAEQGSSPAKQILDTIQDSGAQNRYIATAQVGITIVSLGLGMYGEHRLAEWILELFHDVEFITEAAAHTIATILAVGALTYLHVVIGEMIPKSIALQEAENTAIRLNRLMNILKIVFSPAVILLNFLGDQLTKIFHVPSANDTDRLFTPDELEFIAEESLDTVEQLFFENILDLSERTVSQVMTPRNKLVGIPSDASQPDTLEIVCASTKTRYPVYQENMDNIIGILHIKDLARHMVEEDQTFEVEKMMRPAKFVPETLHLNNLLRQFQNENLQLAVAFDEFGGIAGLVTIEDLIEEVVGEIQDEFDMEEVPPIRELEKGILHVKGNVILDELNQHYHLDWEHEDANNISGLVMSLLGRIPQPDDFVDFHGAKIIVDEIEGYAVKSVRIQLPPP